MSSTILFEAVIPDKFPAKIMRSSHNLHRIAYGERILTLSPVNQVQQFQARVMPGSIEIKDTPKKLT